MNLVWPWHKFCSITTLHYINSLFLVHYVRGSCCSSGGKGGGQLITGLATCQNTLGKTLVCEFKAIIWSTVGYQGNSHYYSSVVRSDRYKLLLFISLCIYLCCQIILFLSAPWRSNTMKNCIRYTFAHTSFWTVAVYKLRHQKVVNDGLNGLTV